MQEVTVSLISLKFPFCLPLRRLNKKDEKINVSIIELFTCMLELSEVFNLNELICEGISEPCIGLSHSNRVFLIYTLQYQVTFPYS